MGAFLVTFEPVLLVVHFLAALFLITVILLQAGKGTDIGAMFGAGSSASLFGARGAATLLTKLTTVTAVVFLFTSLSLATISHYNASGGVGSSVIDVKEESQQEKIEQTPQVEDVKEEQAAPVQEESQNSTE